MKKKLFAFALAAAFLLAAAGLMLSGGAKQTASAAADAKHADFVTVSAGNNHSLALDADGNLWAWGYNNRGQLGDGSTTQRTSPKQITAGVGGSVTEFKAVSAGNNHSLALDAGGGLWAWGYNNRGQLGDGSTDESHIPVQIKAGAGGSVTEFRAVSAGQYHSLALDADGGLWAFGANYCGQLGDGSTDESHIPVQIKAGGGSVTEFKAVSAGYLHNFALDADDRLWAWGYNNHGRLGDGSTTQSHIPVQIKAGGGSVTEFKSVNAGVEHSLALDADGNLWAWGRNYSGRLGDGTTDDRHIPVQIKAGVGGSVTEFKAASAGGTHSLALDADGNLWAWGYNNYGQLGDGTTVESYIPVPITAEFRVVSAGNGYNLALNTDGGLWAWGYNNRGQLGDGTTTQRNIPKYIAGGHYAATVTGGAGGGKYAAGDIVTITADAAPAGKVFDEWAASDGVTFADANSATTTFVMPNKAVTVTAAYKDAPTTPEEQTPEDTEPKDTEPTDTTPTEQTPKDTEPKDTGKGKHGLGGGAIAGIVIGSVAGAAAIGFAVYWFVFRKKKKAI